MKTERSALKASGQLQPIVTDPELEIVTLPNCTDACKKAIEKEFMKRLDELSR